MISLSTAQSNAVNAPIGVAMQVLASAGSGKTRVLTERVRFILSNTKRDSIIALTFTNKAAEEMSERLGNSEEIQKRCWISTIHSVAQRILEKYGHTIGLPSELHIYEREKDRMEVFLQSLRERGIDIDDYLNVSDSKQKKSREKIIQGYLDGFSLIKRELLTEEEINIKFPHDERFLSIYNDYQNALLASGGIDYDDILVYTHKLLMTHEWIGNIYRAKYKHICIDEAQDLNKAQYEFIKSYCGDDIKSVMMVGDPNQMIYGFNGSSTDFLCINFIQDFNPLTFTIKENYRSSRAIIEVANKLRPGSQDINNAALKGHVEIKKCTDEQDEAEWIKDTILNLLELSSHEEIEEDISLKDMVIIARNRYVFSILEKTLDENNISYNLRKGERSEDPDSDFGKCLDYGIRLKLNPKDWVNGKKLCSVLGIPLSKSWNEKLVLVNFSNAIADSAPHRKILSDLLIDINHLDLETPNIRKLTSTFLKKITEIARIENDEKIKSELERSIQELHLFQKYWTRFKTKGLGESLSAFRNAMALGQLSEEVVHGGITLSTVHTMKGLERDIVFIIGMCEGVFPDYRAKTKLELEEERNSAFVAITRAKRWLYISYPAKRMMPWGDLKEQQPSRLLREMIA